MVSTFPSLTLHLFRSEVGVSDPADRLRRG